MIAVHEHATDELAIAHADTSCRHVGYHDRSMIEFMRSAASLRCSASTPAGDTRLTSQNPGEELRLVIVAGVRSTPERSQWSVQNWQDLA
ncbi:hypothetical protein [Bradyrhizobium sp. INPA03-11B]|uniref:hypothetical protein n=1 Tax=Bradyrhizobium sp. INPA03-11B TaxID=418598 RepID=UPI00338E67C6